MTLNPNPTVESISAKDARRKATGYVAFNCGQAFVTEEPRLVGDRWEVPIWAANQTGKIKEVGIIGVGLDGEVEVSEEERLNLKSAAIAALEEAAIG